jgi:hypothetical protein
MAKRAKHRPVHDTAQDVESRLDELVRALARLAAERDDALSRNPETDKRRSGGTKDSR